MHVLEARIAADDVVDDRLALVGDTQTHGAGVLRLTAEAAVVAVLLLERSDVVGGRGCAVGVPGVEQLLERLRVARRVLRLEDRALVPVELEPAERVEDLLDVLRGRALAIRILDSQHEGTP